jgi:uncharacterized protein YgiM (DUF1202 family)
MAGIDGDRDKNVNFRNMKKNFWLLMGLIVATGAVAQSNTNMPAPAAVAAPVAAEFVPADASATNNAPVKIKKRKVIHHRKVVTVKRVALQEPAVTLQPGPAEVAADNVNVRGQAGLKGEFITHLNKGDAVTVLSQINLDKHQIDEPAQWAKIAFPTNAHVWVNSQFIDATNKTVLPRKLNLRAGPGENYSVLGTVERGEPVDILTTRGDWSAIAPPATAYAFIAAMYVRQESSGNLAANPPASTETQPPALTTNVVTETNTVTETNVVTETNIVAETNMVAETNVVVETNTVTVTPPETTLAATTTTIDTNAPAMSMPATPTTAEASEGPRIVTHEGVVRHVLSIIEPTTYEIYDPQTDVDINYLYTASTNLDLSRYSGMRVIVTGEETLADRWPNTPVLTVEHLQVVK